MIYFLFETRLHRRTRSDDDRFNCSINQRRRRLKISSPVSILWKLENENGNCDLHNNKDTAQWRTRRIEGRTGTFLGVKFRFDLSLSRSFVGGEKRSLTRAGMSCKIPRVAFASRIHAFLNECFTFTIFLSIVYSVVSREQTASCLLLLQHD